jgi:cytochrome c biogenesis protein CcdA
MIAAGVIVTLLGFLVSILSLTVTTNVNARLAIVLIGIAISLFGVIGLVNRGFLKKAIWSK